MTHTINLTLGGLSCASCVARAEQAARAVAGVQAASVSLPTETATVSLASNDALAPLLSALERAGYPADTSSTQLDVSGMHCASCIGRVENTLKTQPGVVDATANLTTGQAEIRYLADIVAPPQLAATLSRSGYQATATDPTTSTESDNRHDREAASLRHALLISIALTLPVFIIEMGAHFIPGMATLIEQTLGRQNSWLLQFVLTSLVLIGPGRRFFTTGIPALLRAAPDMNTLVALGTAAAWGYSTLALFLPAIFPAGTQAVYFEAAAVITTLILLGRYLEARAKGQSGAAIEQLLCLQPKTARVRHDGHFVEVAIADIKTGDAVQVRPGEQIAVDGTVSGGQTFIDESMISGEPEAVAKRAGDTVIGGTINGNGTITFETTAVGKDTVLAGIVAMVRQAQATRLPIQSLVNRITAVFVPAVIGVALLSIAIWLTVGPDPPLAMALVAGVSVLIIACPCALGLATPTSILVGSGRAAELGLLFRRGEALQGLQQTTVIAFDKTGTLTEGKPQLAALHTANGWSRQSLLPILAAVESHSEHPLARAIVRAAGSTELPEASAFNAVTGMGVHGQVGKHQVLIGADRFMAQNNVPLSTLRQAGDSIAGAGQSPVYAAIDGKIAAVTGLTDPLKPQAKPTVAALKKAGLKVAMITGDNRTTANSVAAELGIEHVIAEVTPAGKVAALDTLRNATDKLAFVGDGINDAPALARADTGIAIGSGTDIAIESADIVLMSGNLHGVLNALEVSRQTMRNIHQNLFWAFAYNVALIPLAAGLLYPLTGTLLSPMLAAAAMALSSVFVVSNALRLRRIKSVSDNALTGSDSGTLKSSHAPATH